MQNSNNNLENLLNSLSKHLGKEANDIKNAAQSGNIFQVLNGMDPKEAEKIKQIFSDKNATSKLLASEQAQTLLKGILGEK